MRALSLRRADRCADCGTELPAGTRAHWDQATRTVHCETCVGADDVDGGVTPLDSTAGGSARREHQRRRAKREQEVRSRHPRLGGFLLAVTRDPVSTRVWEQGAAGEEAVGAMLDGGLDIVALHDRRMIGPNGRPTRANIDHLVIAPSGVWVVDAKTHFGPLEVRRSGGILTPRVERLFINNRDRTGLVEGLHHQVQTVQRIVVDAGHTAPVRGALCFVGTDLPWISEQIAGIPLVGRRDLRKLLQRDGDLDASARVELATLLGSRFVAA